MKLSVIFTAVLAALAAGHAAAQQAAPVNDFFERGSPKEYQLKTVYVGGEVRNPGPVDLGTLPLRSVAVKELALNKGKPEFKGAYSFSGYSLCDILNSKLPKKMKADFSPETDLYVEVGNDEGDKAVFSWGEIYYARDNFKALITKTARPINPAGGKTAWPLREVPRLVSGGDLYDTRSISNPVRITVRSVSGAFPYKKYILPFTPELEITAGGKTTVITDPAGIAAKRSRLEPAYVHTLGFEGLTTVEGFVLKDLLLSAGVRQEDSGTGLALVYAKDGSLTVFSLAEIINRNDNADFLVVDKGIDAEDRYALSVAGDFFADRDVRDLDRIEVLKI